MLTSLSIPPLCSAETKIDVLSEENPLVYHKSFYELFETRWLFPECILRTYCYTLQVF